MGYLREAITVAALASHKASVLCFDSYESGSSRQKILSKYSKDYKKANESDLTGQFSHKEAADLMHMARISPELIAAYLFWERNWKEREERDMPPHEIHDYSSEWELQMHEEEWCAAHHLSPFALREVYLLSLLNHYSLQVTWLPVSSSSQSF